jgi:hypothetical protein
MEKCKHCGLVDIDHHDTYRTESGGEIHEQTLGVLPNGNWHFCTHSCPAYPSWKSNTWKELATKLKDGKECCDWCGKETSILVIHHLDYTKPFDDPSNIVIICKGCHLHAHVKKGTLRSVPKKKHAVAGPGFLPALVLPPRG